MNDIKSWREKLKIGKMGERSVKEKGVNRFGMIMAKLAVAHRQEDHVGAPLISIYWDGLKEFPIPMIDKAADIAIKNLKFFPTVAELREILLYMQPSREPVRLLEDKQEAFTDPEKAKERIKVILDLLEGSTFKTTIPYPGEDKPTLELDPKRFKQLERRKKELTKQAQKLMGGK